MATGGALIGALRVTLGLDSSQFESGSKKARATAKRDANAIQAEFSKLKGLAGNIAGLWAGSEIVAAGKRALEYASSLGEVAQQLGVSTKELQEYRYAASQAGVSQDEMDKGLAKLTRTIGEAKAGGKAQATTFRELGVSIQDANGKVYTAGEVIPKLADALSRIKDPATRAKIEVELFGKAGQKLDTLLSGGSAAVNELRNAAQKLGVVLSDQQIQNADDTADKLSALKQVLEANIAGAVANNTNAILALANALGYLAQKSGEAFQNYSNIRNLRGLNLAGSDKAAGSLLSNDQSRQVLKRDIQNKMDANMRARASGKGNAAALDAEFKNLTRGRNAVIRAERAASRIAGAQRPGIPDGALPTVSSTGGGKKGGGASGPTAADRLENYTQEMSDLAAEKLGLEQNITADVRERARLEHERIGTQQAAYEFDLDTKVKAGQLNAADAEQLKLKSQRNAELQATAVNWQLDDELTQQDLEVSRSALASKIEALSGQANLARTADQRRQIELQILDAQFEIYRLELEAIKAKHGSTDAERQIAQAKLDQLGAVKGTATATVNQQNMGPLAAYFDSIPRTADEVNEAFEKIAANGIANMNDALAESATRFLKLKGFAGQLFNQLIADVIRLNLQQMTGGGGGLLGGLLKIGGSIFGGGSAGILSNGLSTASANVGALSVGVGKSGLFGLASGGRIGGFGGTDNNVLAINGIPRARVSANEHLYIEPNAKNDNGRGAGHIATIVPSALFDVVIDRRASAVSAQTVATAAPSISGGTQKAMGRAQSRRLA